MEDYLGFCTFVNFGNSSGTEGESRHENSDYIEVSVYYKIDYVDVLESKVVDYSTIVFSLHGPHKTRLKILSSFPLYENNKILYST